MRFWRRRPRRYREGWASVLDAQGQVLASAPVILTEAPDGSYRTAKPVTLTVTDPGRIAGARYVNADGRVTEVTL